jgi:hypothetical protein
MTDKSAEPPAISTSTGIWTSSRSASTDDDRRAEANRGPVFAGGSSFASCSKLRPSILSLITGLSTRDPEKSVKPQPAVAW